jgi:hypothetical protein
MAPNQTELRDDRVESRDWRRKGGGRGGRTEASGAASISKLVPLRVFTLSFISPSSSAAAAARPLSAAVMTLARARVFGLTRRLAMAREVDEAARGRKTVYYR